MKVSRQRSIGWHQTDFDATDRSLMINDSTAHRGTFGKDQTIVVFRCRNEREILLGQRAGSNR